MRLRILERMGRFKMALEIARGAEGPAAALAFLLAGRDRFRGQPAY